MKVIEYIREKREQIKALEDEIERIKHDDPIMAINTFFEKADIEISAGLHKIKFAEFIDANVELEKELFITRLEHLYQTRKAWIQEDVPSDINDTSLQEFLQTLETERNEWVTRKVDYTYGIQKS